MLTVRTETGEQGSPGACWELQMAGNKDALHQTGRKKATSQRWRAQGRSFDPSESCANKEDHRSQQPSFVWLLQKAFFHSQRVIFLCRWIVSRAKVFSAESIRRTFLQTVLIKSGLASAAAGPSDLAATPPPPHPSFLILVNYAVRELHIFISNVGSVPKYFPKSQ